MPGVPDPATGYATLREGPPEAVIVRSELAERVGSPTGAGSMIAAFVQLTDVQWADAQSPGRLEMLHRFGRTEETRLLTPAHRPQEMLAAHAADALVRRINRLVDEAPNGAAPTVVVTTGDLLDSAQHNELQTMLRVLSGGSARLESGSEAYEGVQDGRHSWAWDPEHAATTWSREHGFPAVPGLLDAARRELAAAGLSIPWLTCHGNHDGLIQGRAPAEIDLPEVLTGTRKVVDAPPGPLGDFVSDPRHLFSGTSIEVTPDPDRRKLRRSEFVEAHLADDAVPAGHGFTERNRRDGTAYYSYDLGPQLRIVMLDTTNPAGGFEGSIDRAQLAWLEAVLADGHARHLDPDGTWVETGNTDRLVVLASHHPRTSMVNGTTSTGDAETESRVLGEEVAELLARFPNVIAWISGHTHRHLVEPFSIGQSSFWEITTASVMEWPSQVRLLQVVDNGDGTLSILSLLADHDAAIRPESGALEVDDLASWHRELAYNDPMSVGGRDARGRPEDRNVELLLPDPRVRHGAEAAQ